MPQLTDEQKKRYLENGGCKCPHCQSDNITTGSSIEVDAGYATQSVVCDDCGAEWQDLYTLTDVVDD